jgi:predicted tellurium resistance membrane protein TerC
MDNSQIIASLIEIAWLNLALCGDNAVTLALATRALPLERRRLGVNIGTILFILLRVALAYALLAIAPLPGFGLTGAALLIFAAHMTAKRGQTQDLPAMPPRRGLGAAMAAALAFDAPTALISMTAIYAAAQGSKPLVMFGLALSIPLLALGSAQMITALRKPPLLWASAALLGWIAGRLATADALAPMAPSVIGDLAAPLGSILAVLLALAATNLKGRKIWGL